VSQQSTFISTPVTGSEAPTPTPEQAAADEAARARATGGAEPVPTDKRPEWLPENFKTVTEFVTSANETRAALTRTQQELSALKKVEQPKAGEQPAPKEGEPPKTGEQPKQGEQPQNPEQAAQQAVQTAGLDVTTWQTEFAQTGDVAEEGRTKIADALKAQFGEAARQVVDQFIDGQKARVSNYSAEVMKVAGGQEQYAEMVTWAKSNMSDAEIGKFNEAVDSFDVTSAKMAVDALKSRFTSARGSAPKLITGENTTPSEQQGFSSTFEMTKAMSDPRYKSDPVYRKSVEQRAMLSNF
jgi:hypothetical protein